MNLTKKLTNLIMHETTRESDECNKSDKDLGSEYCNSCVAEHLANYLIENNVIILPCKINDKFYDVGDFICNGEDPKIREITITNITLDSDGIHAWDNMGIRHDSIEFEMCLFSNKKEVEKIISSRATKITTTVTDKKELKN